MLVLGIESTCDETGCAIVRDGREILSNVIATQVEVHSRFGGVVPELASRRHVDVISSILKRALSEANLLIRDVDAIAVAKGPGLMGALLVGINFAKGLSLSLGKPLIGINHVEAHLYAAMMEKKPDYPALGVVISGGHTALVRIPSPGLYELIGQTQDDAIGEAFDKVAKLLGLPYPGGPHIERLAKDGDILRHLFNCGRIKNRPFDFSYSGLKTAVLYLLKGQNAQKDSLLLISEQEKKDVAACFQATVFSDLIKKIIAAVNQFSCKCILVGGGVSQINYFREKLLKEATAPVFFPGKELCLDNAAMIAGLGSFLYQKGYFALEVNAEPKIPFASKI